MKTFQVKRIQQVLEAEDIPFENEKHFPDGKSLKGATQEYLQSIYETLGGAQEKLPLPQAYEGVIAKDKAITIDGPLAFHRYRLTTFRSGFYENFIGFPVNNYRNYCRKYEKECLKAGLQPAIWHNKASEIHFGPSDEPGEFYKQGSSGWKYLAFQEFALDLLLAEVGFTHIRIAPFDTLMISGSLWRMDKLMMTPGNELGEYFAKHLLRRVNQSS